MELCLLNENNRLASLGYEYNYLKSIYPEWSSELHALGNILPNKNLETIAIHGLVSWYLEQNFNLNLNYNYKTKIMDFLQDPTKITFYDFCRIYKFSQKFIKDSDFIENCNNYKYMFLLKKFSYCTSHNTDFHKFNFKKFSILPFYNYLLEFEFKGKFDDLKLWLLEINLNISDYDYIDNSILSDFISYYPCIKVWGVIFQKFKIILEKSNILKKEYIYKLDRFIDTLQQYIYSLTYWYSMSLKKDICISNEFTEFLKDERLLEIYDLTDDRFTELMKDKIFI